MGQHVGGPGEASEGAGSGWSSLWRSGQWTASKTFGITNSKQKSKAELMKAMGCARMYIQGATNICPVQRRILTALNIYVSVQV